MQKRKCHYCGWEGENDEDFCPVCGLPLDEEPEPGEILTGDDDEI